MSPLGLEEAFPDHLELSAIGEPLMPAWEGLLSAPPKEAAAALADLLALPASVGGELVSRVARVFLLAPRSVERRDVLRLRSLGIGYRDGGFLFFRGNEHWLPFDWPPDFRHPLSRLGLVSFRGQDEIFVNSGPEASAIHRSLSEAGETPSAPLRPFYTDGQDRTSLWVGSDTQRSWAFDRTTCTLSVESEDGFPGWFARHFAASGGA